MIFRKMIFSSFFILIVSFCFFVSFTTASAQAEPLPPVFDDGSLEEAPNPTTDTPIAAGGTDAIAGADAVVGMTPGTDTTAGAGGFDVLGEGFEAVRDLVAAATGVGAGGVTLTSGIPATGGAATSGLIGTATDLGLIEDGVEGNLVKIVMNTAFALLGMVAVVMILIGGFRYVTSGGDQNRITLAKNTIINPRMVRLKK